MKPILMRTPGITEIYTHRIELDAHKKKLEKIKIQRKTHLRYDSLRATQIQSLKQSKNKTFINKFNQQCQAISKQNIALLNKLEHAKPTFSRYSNADKQQRKSSQGFITPYIKRRNAETEKQNIRIGNRMKMMSSSLKAQSLDKDYQKSQQIKKRLMRFISDESKVGLKTQKYFNVLNRSENNSKDIDGRKRNISVMERKSAICHYNVDQITKNRVDTSANTLSKIRKKFRPNTTDNQYLEEGQKKNGFFTTEPKQETYLRKANV